MDEIAVSGEDEENLILLFGKKEVPSPSSSSSSIAATVEQSQTKARTPEEESGRVLREFMTILWYAVLFYAMTLPPMDSLIKNFIPLCRTWFIRNGVKALIYAFLAWIVINRNYLKE